MYPLNQAYQDEQGTPILLQRHGWGGSPYVVKLLPMSWGRGEGELHTFPSKIPPSGNTRPGHVHFVMLCVDSLSSSDISVGKRRACFSTLAQTRASLCEIKLAISWWKDLLSSCHTSALELFRELLNVSLKVWLSHMPNTRAAFGTFSPPSPSSSFRSVIRSEGRFRP